MFEWIKEFLAARLQSVVVKGKKSLFPLIISKIPQRSMVDAILFNLYINNLIDVLKNRGFRRQNKASTRYTWIVQCIAIRYTWIIQFIAIRLAVGHFN